MSEELKVPTCPTCGQTDRVEHASEPRGAAHLLTANLDQDSAADLGQWWCGRCMGWLSHLAGRVPARSGSMFGESPEPKVTVINDEPARGRKKGGRRAGN